VLLLVEDELLFNVNVISRLLLIRKQTRCLFSNTIISLTEVLGFTLELELEDPYLGKQQRLSKQEAESLILNCVPTPKLTPLLAPSSLDLYSRTGNEPDSDPLDNDS
jgi:hypothetical protein